MKNRVLYVILFAIGILMSIHACTKKPDEVMPSDNSIDNYFASQRNKIQTFTFDAEEGSVITGAKGTKVYIGGGTLRTTSGQRITGDVTIELKEITELSDMILNNAPTTSNGNILKSGGSFYISATQNGSTLTLDNNASYFVELAAPRGTTDSMQIYTGLPDASASINWTLMPTDTVNANMPIPSDAKMLKDSLAFYGNIDWGIVNKMHSYVLKCSAFGWVNSDCLSFPSDLVTCPVLPKIDTLFKTAYTRLYYVIPSINSIGIAHSDWYGNFSTPGIPANTHIKLVGLSCINNKYYICIQNYTINCSAPQKPELTFSEIAESDIEEALKGIDIL